MLKRGLPETVRMKHDLHYVDEVFTDESGIVGRFIAIDSIRPNPNQPRQEIGDLSELVASIREKGVLEPLLVRPYLGGYQIIAGERRWRACKEVGLEKVPCIERDVDEKEMMELALIENLQRKDLTAFEESDGLQSLVEKFGYTHAQIAQVIGKSRTSVTEALSLNQMPIEVKALCRQADISSKSLLLQIVRLPDEDEMKKLVERIRSEGLTREDVREEKSKDKTGQKQFSFQAKGKNWSLTLKFSKSHVSNKEITEALSETLDNINK